MNSNSFRGRIEKCATMMKAVGCDVLLLTKPSNMNYRTGDGRLCAYAMIATGGKVAIGIPKTDVMEQA
jgi:Xaa-Pro aminopeptidase